MDTHDACFPHRSCYVNFAEHLQNRWNVNMFYPNAPNRWSHEDWTRFLGMVKAFGYTCFEFWLPPTLFAPPALAGDPVCAQFAAEMREVTAIAHQLGLQVKCLVAVNTIGAEWHFACPNDAEDRVLLNRLWRHWAQELLETDIFGIFPGDPGGCNRNGCTHKTFVDLALDVTSYIQQENPSAVVEVGTWGTPFTGWGDDLRAVPNWDGSFQMLVDERYSTPEVPCHIWNGRQQRAKEAMEYFIYRLPDFPAETMVAINLGFNPDGDATMGGDARVYAREIARTNRIVSWDYSVSEGELINYPHWRLPRMAARRREERSAAPYAGGMCYTMTPKLNLLTLFAAGQFFQRPDADPDAVSRDFCTRVFGEEHAALGELFEAFEIVEGWGHYPRRRWSKEALCSKYDEMVERLESVDMTRCTLPLFPDPETYRQDLLWFARQFREMAGPSPDRERIRREYWQRALAIYDVIPMSVDERAELAANKFSQISMDTTVLASI